MELLFHSPEAAFGLIVVTLQLCLQTLNPALQQSIDPAGRGRLGSVHISFLAVRRGSSVDQSRQGVWVSASQYLFQLLDLVRSSNFRDMKKKAKCDKADALFVQDTCRSRSCILLASTVLSLTFLCCSLLLLLTSIFSFST